MLQKISFKICRRHGGEEHHQKITLALATRITDGC